MRSFNIFNHKWSDKMQIKRLFLPLIALTFGLNVSFAMESSFVKTLADREGNKNNELNQVASKQINTDKNWISNLPVEILYFVIENVMQGSKNLKTINTELINIARLNKKFKALISENNTYNKGLKALIEKLMFEYHKDVHAACQSTTFGKFLSNYIYMSDEEKSLPVLAFFKKLMNNQADMLNERQETILTRVVVGPTGNYDQLLFGYSTPLTWAAIMERKSQDDGKFKLLPLLIQNPFIDINIQTKYGNSLLMHQITKGNAEKVKLLLKHPKIDLSIVNKDNETAASIAKNVANAKVKEVFEKYTNKKSSKAEIEDFKNFECPICLDAVNKSKESKTLNCGHKFHKECINGWLKTSKICPFCKAEVK